jgi:hypothetical protein
MGIRINKILGYGFLDLKTEKVDEYTTIANDPRFNPDGWFCAGWREREEKWTTEGYLKHCEEVINASPEKINHFELQFLIRDDFKSNQFSDIHHMVSYDNEGGKPDVIVFTPFNNKDWCRRDDMIDYYEFGMRNDDLTPSALFVDRPLYPYDNYINNETGEIADKMVREWIYQFRNSNDINVKNMALDALGCELHWTEKWGCSIPESVVEFCRYTNMFVEDKTIFSMIPIIYTYWS